MGTTTNLWVFIYWVIASGPVNNTNISNNIIRTTCSAAASYCDGVFTQNNANYNTIGLYNITVNGTTGKLWNSIFLEQTH